MKIALPEQLKAPDGALAVWVIYDHPRDFPKGFVLRPQFATRSGAVIASPEAWYASDPDTLRSILPPGVVCMARHPQDDPAILETWI